MLPNSSPHARETTEYGLRKTFTIVIVVTGAGQKNKPTYNRIIQFVINKMKTSTVYIQLG